MMSIGVGWNKWVLDAVKVFAYFGLISGIIMFFFTPIEFVPVPNKPDIVRIRVKSLHEIGERASYNCAELWAQITSPPCEVRAPNR